MSSEIVPVKKLVCANMPARVSPKLLAASLAVSALQAAPAPPLDEKPAGQPPRLLPAPEVGEKGGLSFRQVRLEHRAEKRTRTVIVGGRQVVEEVVVLHRLGVAAGPRCGLLRTCPG